MYAGSRLETPRPHEGCSGPASEACQQGIGEDCLTTRLLAVNTVEDRVVVSAHKMHVRSREVNLPPSCAADVSPRRHHVLAKTSLGDDGLVLDGANHWLRYDGCRGTAACLPEARASPGKAHKLVIRRILAFIILPC